jgi:hypothetical protein
MRNFLPVTSFNVSHHIFRFEVAAQGILAAINYNVDFFQTGEGSFEDGIENHWPVTDGEHLLGDPLCQRVYSGPQTRGRYNSFSDLSFCLQGRNAGWRIPQKPFGKISSLFLLQ